MADQMTPDELREAAKRLQKRLEISGGTYGDRSDLRAGADALDRLSNPADRGSIAHELWRSYSGSICGLDGCRYQEGDHDADYECECIECSTTWEGIADALLSQFRILNGGA